MLKARYIPYTLNFKVPSGTSRGILTEKPSWFIFISDSKNTGIGEVSIIPGLSEDDPQQIEPLLNLTCKEINRIVQTPPNYLTHFPAIRFGVESALKDLAGGGKSILFPSCFTRGEAAIPINGLIWMGKPEDMKQQIATKIEQGFRCIKIKIGAIDFQEELKLLKEVRRNYTSNDIELRVDANGAFSPEEALEKLSRLAELDIHSIEQPVKPGQIELMADLCKNSPLPIALDEELIGIHSFSEKEELLGRIHPRYVILKPSLIGGFSAAKEWIDLADQLGIDWWITSALESNIGLNAIAQWTYSLDKPAIHGLGTGSLYTNNIGSPLIIQRDQLHYLPQLNWDLDIIQDEKD